MAKFLINSENSEDTFATSNTLPDAVRVAHEVVLQVPTGEVVSIELDGKVLLSLLRSSSGGVVEQTPTKPMDRRVVLPGYEPALPGGSPASSPTQ